MLHRLYTLSDPSTNEVRYVGVTTQRLHMRLLHHLVLNPKEVTARASWIREIFVDGGVFPVIGLVEEVADREAAFAREQELIKQYRAAGVRLVNAEKMGPPVGRKLTDQQRANISAGHLGLKRGPHTADAKAKMARGQGGRPFRDQHGQVFQTLSEAASHHGLATATICNHLKGKYKTIRKGLTFSYLTSEEM